MKQVYDTPAILSLFFPGLGQLAKEQNKRAVMVFAAMLIPWIIWIIATVINGGIFYGLESVLRSPFLPFVLLLNLFVHLWQIVDAYNCPRDFDLS
jgi:hypothetical protein